MLLNTSHDDTDRSNSVFSELFGREKYSWRLGTVQNLCENCRFSLYDFVGPNCVDTPNSHTIYGIPKFNHFAHNLLHSILQNPETKPKGTAFQEKKL